MIATPSTIEPTPILPPPKSPASSLPLSSFVPSCLRASVPSPVPLSPSDETLLLSLLDANLSLSFLIRHHKMTLDQALVWWRQPHIKRALAELTDLSQARARAIAANDATNAVTALQSCLVLSDTEFYEQADPKTRLRAFESARKAATQVLRLAGLSCAIPRGIAFPGDAAAHPDSAPDPARSPRSKVQPVSPRAITFPGDAPASSVPSFMPNNSALEHPSGSPPVWPRRADALR